MEMSVDLFINPCPPHFNGRNVLCLVTRDFVTITSELKQLWFMPLIKTRAASSDSKKCPPKKHPNRLLKSRYYHTSWPWITSRLGVQIDLLIDLYKSHGNDTLQYVILQYGKTHRDIRDRAILESHKAALFWNLSSVWRRTRNFNCICLPSRVEIRRELAEMQSNRTQLNSKQT